MFLIDLTQIIAGPVNVFFISNATDYEQHLRGGHDVSLTAQAALNFRVLVYNLFLLIEERFGVKKENLYLTHPIMVDQYTNKTAIASDAEYYDEIFNSKSFYYTALLFLSDFGQDFRGGRLVFNDHNKTKYTVDPKIGRVVILTSGAENTYNVERVKSGYRYTLKIPFTCNKKFALNRGSVEDFEKF